MSTPTTVTFPHTKTSPWLDAEIRDRAGRLNVFCRSLLSAASRWVRV